MKNILFLMAALLVSQVGAAQFTPNYDESKVPACVVPDPLKTFKGKKIKNPKQWLKKRRPELLDYFSENVYGKVPGEMKLVSAEVLEQSNNAYNGKAKRKQIELTYEKNGRSLSFVILISIPISQIVSMDL